MVTTHNGVKVVLGCNNNVLLGEKSLELASWKYGIEYCDTCDH